MKKMPGDIILLYIHVYHNEDHMICGSWNIRCNRQKFLLFQDIFLALSDPWHPEKSKFYHWEKTPGDIILLMCTKNPFHPKNQNFEKKEKNAWRCYYFTQVWHKWQSSQKSKRRSNQELTKKNKQKQARFNQEKPRKIHQKCLQFPSEK